MQCRSNPENVERFEIAENEIAFASFQQASSKKKFFPHGKKLSFTNPLASRTANQMTAESSFQTQASQNAVNKTNIELTRESCCSLLRNNKIKCSLLILLIITLVTIIIALTVYYIKCKEKQFPIGQFTSKQKQFKENVFVSISKEKQQEHQSLLQCQP